MKSKGRKPKGTTRKKPSSTSLLPARWLMIWLGLTTVGLVSATAGALLAVSLTNAPLRQASISPEAEQEIFNQSQAVSRKSLRLPELTRPVNIMVLGTKVLTSDLPDSQLPPALQNTGYHATVNSFDGLSDAMLLLRFDPSTEKVTLLSIPRDTKAEVPGLGFTKINNANAQGGPVLAAKSISSLLNDTPIDRYVRINVLGIEKLIDALGGVRLYVPKDMKYTDHSQHLYIDLREGEQTLNGQQALQFLRFRYDRYGDIGRVQRQQTFFRALVEQTLRPSTLLKVPEILSIIQANIDTNLSMEELIALAGLAADTDRSELQMMMLPGEFSGDGKQGVSFWLPNHRQINQLVGQYFGAIVDSGYGRAPSPSSLRIAIQDSTNNPEAVKLLIAQLREEGYTNVFVGDPWSEELEVTRIVAQQGDNASASILRAELGFGEVRVESTGALGSDISIQLGQDWQPVSVAKTKSLEVSWR